MDQTTTITTIEQPVILEKDVPGKIVTVNQIKHYGFIKRTDKLEHNDIFARDASIINPPDKKKFFISDSCKFDIIKTKRGIEAINIHIVQRAINSISQLRKIPKIKRNEQAKTQIPLEAFQSTISELFREVLKKNK